MDTKKTILYAALFFVSFMLWTSWEKEHGKGAHAQPQQVQEQLPVSAAKSLSPVGDLSSDKVPAHRIVHGRTDVLAVDIDMLGGEIIKAQLLDYPDTLDSPDPKTLLNNEPETKYLAQSGLTNLTGSNTKDGKALYSVDKQKFQLEPGQEHLDVTLAWKNSEGLMVQKTFQFERGNYLINLKKQVSNKSSSPWSGHFYSQLIRKKVPTIKKGMFHVSAYLGASISDPANKLYEKISFKKMNESNVSRNIKGGWAAMQQHYFLGAWIPDDTLTHHYFSRVNDGDVYTIGMIGPELKVGPNEQVETQAKLYVGPEKGKELKVIAPGLELTVDYGWLWFISVALFWVMQHIYNVIGNWGWSIVLVTVFIKLGFYRLSASSYRSMAGMRKLQPKIEAIRERYADDKQKLSQGMMELYKKEKINPLGGCLPIVIQIPVFIALYWVLIESVELRQAPFILWIRDLSSPDPFFVLPVLMGISMFVQQKLNPPPPDPTQAKVMMFLPVMFTALFLYFPAGLVLYWFVNNTLSVIQQWHITRGVEGALKPKKANL